MTTTREAALEAALTLARNRLQACAIDHPTGSREMYERSEWADEATAALSTPATEPQGYVEGLEAAMAAIKKVPYDFHQSAYAAALHAVAALILAARPAPQPAADTRVTDAMILEIWGLAQQYDDFDPVFRSKVRAIIGTAQPDKIAEAAHCKQVAEDCKKYNLPQAAGMVASVGREILALPLEADHDALLAEAVRLPEIAGLIADMEEILRISDRNHPTWSRAWAIIRELKPFLALETP